MKYRYNETVLMKIIDNGPKTPKGKKHALGYPKTIWVPIVFNKHHKHIEKHAPHMYKKLWAPWVFFINIERVDRVTTGTMFHRLANCYQIYFRDWKILIGLPWQKSYLEALYKRDGNDFSLKSSLDDNLKLPFSFLVTL